MASLPMENSKDHGGGEFYLSAVLNFSLICLGR